MVYEVSNRKNALDLTAIIILVVLCASWGLQQVAIKIAAKGVSPILQSGIRSIGATILVFLWALLRRESIFDKDGTLWWGIAAGLLFAGEFFLIYLGLGYTNASRAVIFLYLSPFVVALGAQIFIPTERFRTIQVIGLLCAFTGILVAFSESLRFPSYRMLIGDVMLAIAAVFWGATTVLIKASPLLSIRPSKVLLYQLGISAVALPLGSLVMKEQGVVLITPLIVGSLVYQVFWIASVTYLAWFWLLRYYPASHLASFTFLTPLFGVLAGGMILHEPITHSLLLALVLVGGGIYMVNHPASR